jgi:hypothetical protein
MAIVALTATLFATIFSLSAPAQAWWIGECNMHWGNERPYC